KIGADLRTPDAKEGRSRAASDETPGRAVPALRLPAHPDLPAPRRSRDELGARPPALAPGRAAAAEEALAQAGSGLTATAAGTDRPQQRLGLRLRLRRLCQRATDQVLDRDRRVHARMSGDRCGGRHSVEAGDRSAQPAGIGAWRTALPAIGQWPRIRQSPDPGVDRGVGNRLGADRSRQALAERHRRELQRPLPGRMSESRVVPQPARSASDHRNLAAALQPGPPALESGLPYPGRVRRQSPFHQPEGRSLETPGPKLPGQVMTTEWFANRVETRWRRCVARGHTGDAARSRGAARLARARYP